MKQITARQFRVKFPTLEEQVSVTINRDGELVTLGTWTPAGSDLGSEYGRLLAERDRLIDQGADPNELERPRAPLNPIRAASQKDRDAILRGVNRSGSVRR